MERARDVLDPSPILVHPTTSVITLARQIHAAHAEGAAVIDDGRLVGVVTTFDLMFRTRKPHLPPVLVLLDAVIPLGNPFALARERQKIAAATAGDLMSTEPVTVSPDTPLDELASRMIDERLTFVPVVEGDRLLGVVTRHGVLGALLGVVEDG